MESKISLEPGTQITCQRHNHLVCEVIETITQGDRYANKLGNWQIPKPETGSFPVCHCGSLFWYSGIPNFFSVLLHVKDQGWISNQGTLKYIEEPTSVGFIIE